MNWKLIKALWNYMQNTPRIKAQIPELAQITRRSFGLMVAFEMAQIAQIYPYKYFYNFLVDPRKNVWYPLGIAVAIAVAHEISTWIFTHMDAERNGFLHRIRALLWGEAHRKELELNMDWHTRHGTGEKEAIIAKNASKAENLIDGFLFNAAPIILRIIATSLAMFVLGWMYGVLAIITVTLYVLVMLWIFPKIRPLQEEYHKEMKFLEKHGSELTQQVRTIQTFGLERFFSDRNEGHLLDSWKNEKIRHPQWRGQLNKLEQVIISSRWVLHALGIISAKLFGASVGSVILVFGWMDRIYSNFHQLSQFQRHFQQDTPALNELMEILLTQPSVPQPTEPEWPKEVRGKVEFRNLSFRYPESETDALSGINLIAEPGEVIALIGRTGSGKTTSLSLLQRDYDPTSGEILIDGAPLNRLDKFRYRSEILGVVPQHTQLFDSSIRDNIRISRMDAGLGEEEEAARLAFAEEFILELPQGYDTLVGENGVRLSGGQRQRLAIARALHRKPRILILDEPTSALDGESQSQVQKAIDEIVARRECTVFVIAHRFSTILNADRVAVFEGGRIVETGTHTELAKRNGRYMHFRNLELSGYLTAEPVA
jgi:ABC-type multidrug transport system fused ATPase/permease subunit